MFYNFDHRKYCYLDIFPKIKKRNWINKKISKAPIWVSEDLRDGNQSISEPMNVEQKKNLWTLLINIGIKEIMVGFPSASKADFDFVRWLIRNKQIPSDVTIAVLVQARKHLIQRTFESLIGINNAIIHFYNSTSPIQRDRVFKTNKEGIISIAAKGANYILQQTKKYNKVFWIIEYTPESFSNTELDFSLNICELVLDILSPKNIYKVILNLPTTVDVASPHIYADQIEYFCNNISKRDKVIISVHTHNDRGSAVSSAELASLAGAKRIEGTLLGNGERTGNMDLITLAMNLYSQGIDPKIDLSCPEELIDIVTECTKIPIHPRHPWIGELVYTAFSGSHQDAIRKSLKKQKPNEIWQVAYLPIDPNDIGRNYKYVIRLNSQSGKSGMAFLLERDYKIKFPRWMMIALAQLVQKESDKKMLELSSYDIYHILKNNFFLEKPFNLLTYIFNINKNIFQLYINNKIYLNIYYSIIDGMKKLILLFISNWKNHQMKLINYYIQKINNYYIAFINININEKNLIGIAIDIEKFSVVLKSLLSAINKYMLSG
ncbi:2-isopropylmalate synthase [Candidatus Portiera aleyrodidarum]|uniref:2-isopropylmalate synthase n=1 Tax=Candidatus Portiera aleyrodidarum TV TaxID=1297582 RepID=A0A8D3XAP8_9GAMM|nr:2-isopropylmalate synthase [Candidatus Portiera aleyrodidarum]AGI27039.1 isopropylmalate/homocitrate/citramalate synthase [Candidatus Portiera aleyrodidarum TV]CEI58998.1 2-isopropylmalate synthase [Candidatus Portiera aleyrodidarum]